MKSTVYLLVFLVLPALVTGQDQGKVLAEVRVTPPAFTGIEKVAGYPVNSSADLFEEYLTNNFQYPERALECYVEGTAVVQFSVTKEGELTGFRVINGVCPEIDEEFIRVLKTTSGMWRPGSNNGSPVPMEKEVSMMFVAGANIDNPLEIFIRNAKNNFDKGNDLFLKRKKPGKALKYYEKSVRYLPYETSSLLLRGLCRYELGDMEAACSDWNRINELGKYNADEFVDKLCGLKGYAEMTRILKNSQAKTGY